MDAEGLGRKLLLTPPPTPGEPHEKQTVGSISQNANPASTFELSQCRHCKERLPWAEERLLGDLRQSVPQNGRVHLHIVDTFICLQKAWQRGSTGVERYGCIQRSAANNLGEIPQKMGALNPLF